MTVAHPALERVRQERAASLQLRVADAITKFAGRMLFVYIHAVIFAAWIITDGFGSDPRPWNTLTLIVSLEAIFLSTFVMIGQNRQADVAAAKAAHDFTEQEQELKVNTDLTREVHRIVTLLEPKGPAVAKPKKS